MGAAAYNRGSRSISDQISAEMEGRVQAVAVNHPTEAELPKVENYEPSDIRADKTLAVGDKVFCTVSAIRQWMTVTEIKGKGSNLRIKTNGFNGWGYGHNFTKTPPAWMVRS
jgi:hypothetical protein